MTKSNLILLFALLTMLMQACSGRTVETIIVDQQPTAPESGDFAGIEDETLDKILRLGEINPIIGFDPLFATNSASQRVIQLIYEGLVSLDENDEIVPAVASRWQVSQDSLEYTFHLNRNAFFHDDSSFGSGIGRRVRASDFKFAFERMATRDVPPNAAQLFMENIRGFEAFFYEQREIYLPGQRTLNEISGIRAANDSTLSISLVERDPDFLTKLASPYGVVYPREALRYRQDGLKSHAVGSGPFLFSSSHGDSLIILSVNRDYHQTIPRPNRIEILNVSNETDIFRQLSIGNLNGIMELGPLMVRSLVNDSNELEHTYRDRYELFAINHNEPYIIRYNQENRFGFSPRHASALANSINIDSLRTRLGNPSLELVYQVDGINGDDYLEDLQRRFSPRQDNRRLFLSIQPDVSSLFLGAEIINEFNQEVNARLMERRLSTREISLFLEHDIRFTGQGQRNLLPQEILRFHKDRYFLIDDTVQGVQFNSYSWWINVTDVEMADIPS